MNASGPGPAISVLFEDEHLVAVDKPPGRLVIPGRAGSETSLREELEDDWGRLFVVHRLDRGTSGVLVFARSAADHRSLNLAFDRGEPKKSYLALVRGRPHSEFKVNVGIAKGRRGRMRPARPGEVGAKPSETSFRLVEAFVGGEGRPDLALLECRPTTGRTHQIRVHLAHAGVALAVDPDYGDPGPLSIESGVTLIRTPLHAERLTLRHPTTGEPLEIRAPIPRDLSLVLDALRKRA